MRVSSVLLLDRDGRAHRLLDNNGRRFIFARALAEIKAEDQPRQRVTAADKLYDRIAVHVRNNNERQHGDGAAEQREEDEADCEAFHIAREQTAGPFLASA